MKILRDLEERGLVEVTKGRKNRYGQTLVSLSAEGERERRELLQTLNELADR